MSQSTGIAAAIQRLSSHVETVPVKFLSLPQDTLLQKPAPNKWSKQEILGHLVDSAINNLKRFTDTQCQPQPYTIIRYMQDELVRINNYQQLPTEHIVALWVALNKQVIEVTQIIPADKLAYIIISSNNETKTLEWLIIDYVDHLEHHLKQVFG